MTRATFPAVSWILLVTALVAASPDAQASIIKGPYLQNLTQSTIIARWETSVAQGGAVQYGLTGAFGSETDQTGVSAQHEIQLNGLLPDTLYYYRAISDSDTSASAVFHTPVRSGKNFRFLVYGDNRTDTASHQRVVDQMKLASPPGALVIDTGDLTASGSVGDYQTFFDVTGGMISHEPLYPCIGNHDIGSLTNWATYFSLPNNEHWYSFRYGSVAFHTLDLYSSYTPGSAQYNWFLGELQADSADVTVRHIIVTFHEPPYTTNTGHPSNLTVRQYICPLLDRFKVKLTFQGHVHCYEHSLANGVHYVISGGGGAPLYGNWGAAQPWTVYRETCYEFTQVDVRGDTLAVRTIKPGGAVIDPFIVVQEPSAVLDPGGSGSTGMRLQVGPNPVSGMVRMDFDLPRAEHASLAVYNPAGRREALLIEGNIPSGERACELQTGRLSAGVYFAVLRTSEGSLTRQFIVLR